MIGPFLSLLRSYHWKTVHRHLPCICIESNSADLTIDSSFSRTPCHCCPVEYAVWCCGIACSVVAADSVSIGYSVERSINSDTVGVGCNGDGVGTGDEFE